MFNPEAEEYEMISSLEGHESEVKSVSWRADDEKLATCSRDKNIWVWEFDPISYDYVCDSVLEGHSQDVKSIQWLDAFPNTLLSTSYDNSLRVWEGQDDDYVCKQILDAHNSIVWNAILEEGGRMIYSVSEDTQAIKWQFNP